MGDFNLALVIVAIVVCIIVFIFNFYLLVNYQHPDDANHAYFPKIVVVLGLSIAAISILMLPADVANRQACRNSIYNGACNLTLPMKGLWLAVYIIDAVLVFFVIPFAMFYYEGDLDKSVGKRIKSALLWMVTTAFVCALVLGILYGMPLFTARLFHLETIPFLSVCGVGLSYTSCVNFPPFFELNISCVNLTVGSGLVEMQSYSLKLSYWVIGFFIIYFLTTSSAEQPFNVKYGFLIINVVGHILKWVEFSFSRIASLKN